VKDKVRVAMLVALFQQRPENKRTRDDVVEFYRWLEEKRPELLKRYASDPYQRLQADLRRYIHEKKR
jgi:hypothetical protein